MRIDSGSSNIPSVPGRTPGKPLRRAPISTTSSEQLSESASSSSSEMTSLLSGLNDVADIRMDVVEEVRQRLNRGEHLTRDAAEKTAAAILADLASFIGH